MVEDTLVLRMVERGAAATAAGVTKVAGALRGLAASSASASKKTIAMGRSTRYVGRELTHGLTVPIVAVGAAAVKMNIDWTQAMTNVVTQTHYTQGQVSGLNDQVLNMSKRFPQGPNAFAEALLHLAKIGVPANKVMADLSASAKAATIGGAQLPHVAEAAGAAWLSGIKGGKDFNNIIHEMTAAVGTGNISMEQFTRAMGTGVLPAAKVAGLGIDDVFGALALLTDEGYQGSSAMAQMATALHFLYNPTKKAEDALEGIGLTGTVLATDMHKPRGLLVALTDLRKHLDLLPGGHKGIMAEQTLGDIFPGGRGRVMLTLLNQLDRYQMKMDQINTVQGTFEQRFHKSMETPLNKMKTAWTSIQVDLIRVGGDLLPMVAVGFSKVADFIDKLLTGFHNLSPGTQKWVIIGLAVLAVLGPMLVIVGTLVLTIGALISPVTAVVAFFIVFVTTLTILYHKVGLVHDAIDILWKIFGYTTPLGALLQHFGFFKDLMTSIPGAMKTGWESAINFIIDRINDLLSAVNTVSGPLSKIPGVPDLHINPLNHVGQQGKFDALAAVANQQLLQGVGPRPNATRGGAPSLLPAPFKAPPVARKRPAGDDSPFPQLVVPVTVMTQDGDVIGKAVGKSNRKKKSTR